VTNDLPVPITEERHAAIVQSLEGLHQGKSLRQIAEELAIPYSTLRIWLLAEVPEKYRAAQQQALLARIAEADEELETADSHLAVARADRVCKYARWDAEHRLPTLFATRSEVSGPGGGPIQLDNGERARRAAFLRSLDAKDVEILGESSHASPTASESPENASSING
jgi:uncharacterized protein (DUF2249 family)